MSRADPAVARFGAAVLLRQLNALTGEIEGVRQAADPEYLHRLRVASRRLRASLPLFAPHLAPRQAGNWQREIRRLTRALGQARDADVQIEQVQAFASGQPRELRPGLNRLLLRLRQERARRQVEVLQSLEQFENSGAAERLRERISAEPESGEERSPALYALAWQSAREKLAAFLTFTPYVHQPDCVSELHAMRISAKQLRYTLEIFAPLYPGELKPEISTVKEIQSLLGGLHDSDVWLEALPDFIAAEQRRTLRYFGHNRPFKRLAPGLLAFMEHQQQRRFDFYQRFAAQWDKDQQSSAWTRLAAVLQQTCPPAVAEPYPPMERHENHRVDR